MFISVFIVIKQIGFGILKINPKWVSLECHSRTLSVRHYVVFLIDWQFISLNQKKHTVNMEHVWYNNIKYINSATTQLNKMHTTSCTTLWCCSNKYSVTSIIQKRTNSEIWSAYIVKDKDKFLKCPRIAKAWTLKKRWDQVFV